MKTTIKKMMLSAMIVLVASANALAFEDSLMVNDNKSFDLVLPKVMNTTEITLKDKRNNVLYQQTVNKGESFAKTFNMELLANGAYTVELDDESKTEVLIVEVLTNHLEKSLAESRKFFKPVISERNGLVYVTQFSPDQDPLYIAIYNSQDELIHEENLTGRMDLGKVFNFSQTKSGEYHFYTESKGNVNNQLVYVEN